MDRFTVLVTARQLVPEAVARLRQAGARIEFMDDPVTETSLLGRLSAGPVEALLLRGSPPVTARVIEAGSALRIIAKNGAGIDSVDLEAADRRGITVAVAASGNADAVAEQALALMMALVRDLPALDRRLRRGEWAGSGWIGRDFRDSVVGIVGFGSIGRRTASLAAAVGARVVVLASPGRSVDGFETEADLPRLLARCDVLSLHCPLTARTRGLIGRAELALMKPGSFLVNTARGAVVDERALADALANGHLAGAGLDTFAQEPLPCDSPLLGLDNVLLTPHVAGVTAQAALRVALLTAQNVIDCLTGRSLPAPHLVRPPSVASPSKERQP